MRHGLRHVPFGRRSRHRSRLPPCRQRAKTDIYAHCRRDGSCNGKWTNGNRVALAGRQLKYHITTRLLTPLAQLWELCFRGANMKFIKTDSGEIGLLVELPIGTHVVEIAKSVAIFTAHDPASGALINGTMKEKSAWVALVNNWRYLRIPLALLARTAMANPDDPRHAVYPLMQVWKTKGILAWHCLARHYRRHRFGYSRSDRAARYGETICRTRCRTRRTGYALNGKKCSRDRFLTALGPAGAKRIDKFEA